MSRQPLNIVILGGSFAGLAVAHHFLDHIIHQLGTFDGAPTYRVVLVSPSSHLYWNICAPRALVSPSLIHTEDAFIPIEPAFARHPFNEFAFMQGVATGIDTSAKQVTVGLVRGSKTQTIAYHALVIATGSSTYSPLYSLHGTHEETSAEIRNLHRKLEVAGSVLIVGGGPSGVETAGQLATYYNQRRRWQSLKDRKLHPKLVAKFDCLGRADNVKPDPEKRGQWTSSIPTSPRHKWRGNRDSAISGHVSSSSRPPMDQDIPLFPAARARETITLLSGGDRLLPRLAPNIGKRAERKLRDLGVHVFHNRREISNIKNVDGSASCILNDGVAITSDVLISATGIYPNTGFLPTNMLDQNGYVTTNTQTLRVHGLGVGDRIYAVGDCADYSKNYLLDIYEAIPHLMKNLHNDLLTHEYRLQTVTSITDPKSLAKTASIPTASGKTGEEDTSKPTKSISLPPHEHPDPNTPTEAPATGKRTPSPIIPKTISKMLRPRLSFLAPVPALPSSTSTPTTSHHPPRRKALLTSEEARRKIEALQDSHFEPNPTDSQLMPITRFGGVGVMFNVRVPSFLVYLVKGRNYRMGKAKEVVGRGRDPYSA